MKTITTIPVPDFVLACSPTKTEAGSKGQINPKHRPRAWKQLAPYPHELPSATSTSPKTPTFSAKLSKRETSTPPGPGS
ncbi:hypothetical protein TNCT_178071 [Trichonephila clavata]|uniref:Uncharacterized protein n=1 Tax=Trichonephila clavata TaxID=2740835 RepID=A0A8X6KZC2_TRICU|nr:hypothetical protein TNCT_178071 [Trichonephila clavata]